MFRLPPSSCETYPFDLPNFFAKSDRLTPALSIASQISSVASRISRSCSSRRLSSGQLAIRSLKFCLILLPIPSLAVLTDDSLCTLKLAFSPLILLLPQSVHQEPISSLLKTCYANLKPLELVNITSELLELFAIVNLAFLGNTLEKDNNLSAFRRIEPVNEFLRWHISVRVGSIANRPPCTFLNKIVGGVIVLTAHSSLR